MKEWLFNHCGSYWCQLIKSPLGSICGALALSTYCTKHWMDQGRVGYCYVQGQIVQFLFILVNCFQTHYSDTTWASHLKSSAILLIFQKFLSVRQQRKHLSSVLLLLSDGNPSVTGGSPLEVPGMLKAFQYTNNGYHTVLHWSFYQFKIKSLYAKILF